MDRYPMTPSEFDQACRDLTRACPWLSETSGYRSEQHNADVGGLPGSKHLLGMARDFHAPDEAGVQQGHAYALRLGLWVKPYLASRDGKNQLHVQGLPVGDIPEWWEEKYL